nr:hypothetical protein [uncultured Desulfobulbus sp.]
MKKKFSTMIFAGMLIGCSFNVALANVDLGTNYWIWEGTGFTSTFRLSNSAGVNFTLVSTVDSSEYLTFYNGTSYAGITVAKNNDSSSLTYGHYFVDNITDSLAAIDIGTKDEFYFEFDGSNYYNIETDDGHTLYTLTSSSGTMEVFVGNAGNITPSAVPVPSSALLLGSSVLGLVGLGSRRKKA